MKYIDLTEVQQQELLKQDVKRISCISQKSCTFAPAKAAHAEGGAKVFFMFDGIKLHFFLHLFVYVRKLSYLCSRKGFCET